MTFEGNNAKDIWLGKRSILGHEGEGCEVDEYNIP